MTSEAGIERGPSGPPASTAEGAASRQRILDAARGAFSELGFVGASLSEIARRAQMSVPGMYRHFESKAHLLVAVLEEALGELRDPAPSGLPELVNWYAQPERQQVRRLVVEMHAAALRDDTVAPLVRDFALRSEKALRENLADAGGTADAPSTHHRIVILFMLMMGMCQIDSIAPELIGDPAFGDFVGDAVQRLVDNDGLASS